MSEQPGIPPHRVPRTLRILGVLAFNTVGVVAVLSFFRPGWPSTWLILGLLLVSFLVAYRWDLTKDPYFRRPWFGIALLTAIASVLTGWHNGLTDEPYLMLAFAQLWPNLYGSSITVHYMQAGIPYSTAHLYNVYLPFLVFLQFPFIDYRWTAIAAWAASVYALGRRHEAVVLWGNLWVGLMAANGFNDFVPFLGLTLTFVVWEGIPSRAFEYLSLGMKQFANLIVVGVHLYRRQWRDALIAVAVTAAILAPFAYLSPSGVVCHVLLIQPLSCSEGPGGALGPGFGHHINYLLWPLFVLAVFVPAWLRHLRSVATTGWRGWIGDRMRRYSRPNPRPAGR